MTATVASKRAGVATFSTAQTFAQSRYEFEPETGTLWSFMRPHPRPSFTPSMLGEMETVEAAIEKSGGLIEHRGAVQQLRNIVFASDTAGVWNLGGDLATFRTAILARDRDLLREYGLLCVRGMYRRHRGYGAGITTISLVEGDALGGGFEGVLASDIIVAAPAARFGFPEMKFNLFPGMGALTFLSRRIGLVATRDIVSGADIFAARAMHEARIVDVLAEDARVAARDLIAKRSRFANGHAAISAAARCVSPVSLRELEAVVDIWADAALNLNDLNLRTMEVLVRKQDRLAARNSANEPRAEETCA